MNDLHDQPSDGERDQLSERISRLAREGRIGEADRDIRLVNVKSAQSRAELDLMVRDLDQIEVSLSPSSSPAGQVFSPPASGAGGGSGAGRKVAGVLVLVTVVVTFVGVVVAFIVFVGNKVSSSTEAPPLPPAETVAPEPPVEPGEDPTADPSVTPTAVPEVRARYSLSVPGLRTFLATYRQKFRTPLAMDLVLYPEYAVVNVPIKGGKGRQAGWLFRKDDGWTSFGGVRAIFPGSAPVDTRRLDTAALVRNIARARRTLEVEKPTQNYVVIRFIPRFEPKPSVNIYVSNEYGESGYLATTMDGVVNQVYPFRG